MKQTTKEWIQAFAYWTILLSISLTIMYLQK